MGIVATRCAKNGSPGGGRLAGAAEAELLGALVAVLLDEGLDYRLRELLAGLHIAPRSHRDLRGYVRTGVGYHAVSVRIDQLLKAIDICIRKILVVNDDPPMLKVVDEHLVFDPLS